jgi:Uncharacterized protein conserved in bacteria (DUF2188)
MPKNQHVVPSGDKWSIRKAGSSRASGVYESKPEAVQAARGIARNQNSGVFIHSSDGRIQLHESASSKPSPKK